MVCICIVYDKILNNSISVNDKFLNEDFEFIYFEKNTFCKNRYVIEFLIF